MLNIYEVGGSVRDRLLGLQSKDKDFVVVFDDISIGIVSEDTLTELLKNNQLSITSKHREDINFHTCIITADNQGWDYYFEKYCPKYYHKDFNLLFKTKIQYCKYEDADKLFYDDKYSTNYTEVLINKLYNKE